MGIPEIFRYEKVKAPEGTYCLISPSFLAQLYINPWKWYEHEVLGKEADFQGNTASVTGTICHYIYKLAAQNKNYDPDEIKEQLTIYDKMRPELKLDIKKILSDYPGVSSTVIHSYNMINHNAKIEYKILSEVMNGIYIGGHIDRIENKTIIDFKTVSRAPKENKIAIGYKLQLMAYAAACIKQGMEINNICVVYGIKPTKTHGARCIILKESITDENKKLIEYTINLISSALEKCRFDKSLVPIIFRDFDSISLY